MNICILCEKEYKPTRSNQKYCSLKCFHKSREKKVVINCEYCGKEILILPHDVDKRRFCSYSCNNKSRSKNPEPQAKKCARCEKVFIPDRSRPEKFCSRKCAYEYRKLNSREWKICEYCGMPMFVPKYIKNQKYCSKRCGDMGKNLFGKNNPNWKGGIANNIYRGTNWKEQSSKARKRDNRQCQLCGNPSTDGIKLVVHHIIPYRLFNKNWKLANRIENLITLCNRCHPPVEHHKIQCPMPDPWQIISFFLLFFIPDILRED